MLPKPSPMVGENEKEDLMFYFVLSILMLAVLTFQIYNIINFKNVITDFQGRIDQLQGKIDREQSETRALLTAYMTETRVISFYDDITPLIRDEEVAQLFRNLVRDEEKHVRLLENCLEKR